MLAVKISPVNILERGKDFLRKKRVVETRLERII